MQKKNFENELNELQKEEIKKYFKNIKIDVNYL